MLSKFAYTNLYTKGPYFQVVVRVVRHKINPFNIKAVMLDIPVSRMHTCAGSSESLSHVVNTKISWKLHVRIQRGGRGQGSGPPLKNHKNIGFSSNTGPDPLKNRSCEASIQYWAFGPLMARLKWDLDPPSIINFKKTLSKLDPL